jgi:hypothetical protein
VLVVQIFRICVACHFDFALVGVLFLLIYYFFFFTQDREFLRSTMWPLKLDDHLLVPVGIQRLIWNAQVCILGVDG